ncbi:metal-dependent hydrolase [Paenibacillus glufosinatiresistens]|uniref:metal-dependent hydrolase n=1 Tax=Paenibacillus glufosinatiresistens TaxID=3070657 RepID=UPI00286E2A10|nr:metal-dependent hydrolase [Paenibacillus sp. YX.27]
MDTATHFVMGFGLAGLSFVDPAVASDHKLAAAVMLATLIGSQAPDADTALRLKNNAVYIRNHRGITHSLPFLLLWPALITLVLTPLFGFIGHSHEILHLALWSLVAVVVHVFTDIFNTYGTQAARPFTERWIALNIIHIFDPFIFGSHVAAIALWVTGLVPPAPLFVTLYSVIALYYMWRTAIHIRLTRRISRRDDHGPGDRYMAIPTISLHRWNIVKCRRDGSYDIGVLAGGRLEWIKHSKGMKHPAIEESRKHPDVRAFLYFTSYAVAEVEELPSGYIVRWGDVRYLHRKQFPFVAVVVMDRHYRPMQTYVGWLSSEKLDERFAVSPGS